MSVPAPTPFPLPRLGTPLDAAATRVMLLGAGELGKEVIIALQRLGVETIAVDRYADAPGMQVAHRAHVVSMTDAAALRALIEKELLTPKEVGVLRIAMQIPAKLPTEKQCAILLDVLGRARAEGIVVER